jgi:hypothetical protein
MKRFPLSLAAITAVICCAPAFAAVTTNTSIPIDTTVAIPCANGGAGENVEITGPLHMLATDTTNANNVHLSVQFQPQGLSGVGSVTGEKYRATGVTRQDFNAANVRLPFNTTFVNNFRIIGQRTSNNFLVHENAHVTLNANGSVTAVLDNFKADCK